MRFLFLVGLFAISVPSGGQIMTLIATHKNGERDTVTFGFVQDASLDVDIALGELNLFQTPVNGYEGRVLQRDSSNFSCAQEPLDTMIYYTNNFDSKINFRDPIDTSLQNRLFEIWYSDEEIDSMEMICDIPLSSFIYAAYIYPCECSGNPPCPAGILVLQDDTIRHIKYKITLGIGIKQHIIIANRDINITAIEEKSTESIISIYPNPTSGHLYFKYSNPGEIKEVCMYDMMGRLIKQVDGKLGSTGIDLNGYNSGMYMLLFKLENGAHMVKMIIKQ